MQFVGARWLLGGPGWSLGDAGGCQVVLGCKKNVLESLGKGDFCPLAPRGTGSVGSVLHYREELNPPVVQGWVEKCCGMTMRLPSAAGLGHHVTTSIRK